MLSLIASKTQYVISIKRFLVFGFFCSTVFTNLEDKDIADDPADPSGGGSSFF